MPINSVIRHACDLTRPLTITALSHALVSGDDQGDRFEVTVTRGREAVAMDGASVQAYFIRSSDGYTIPVVGSASGNVASVTLPAACYAVPGRFTLTVKATMAGVRHAVYVCEGAVLRSMTDALIDPARTIPDLQELLAKIDQMEKGVSAANAAAKAANDAATAASTASTAASTAAGKASDAANIAAKWGSVTATVTMLAADQPATVTLTDTTTGKSLAFRLPRGLTGLTPSLTVGTVKTGAPGTKATATLTGTAEAPVLNLTIPQGDVGSITNLTVCGKASDGSGNIALSAADVGALASNGVAKSAEKLKTPRAIAVTGDVEGSASFDGSGDATISARIIIPRNSLYADRDLKKYFGSAKSFAEACRGGDFSGIFVGDYWPATLTGTVRDCASGTNKQLHNAVVLHEVAGINPYINYGDAPITAPHLVMCSRDLLPITLLYRSANEAWHRQDTSSPWLGSALYETLNNETDGLLPLLLATDLGPYVFSGKNGKGMRVLGEAKAAGASDATGWSWVDRGRVFIPFEREIWGASTWSEPVWGAGLAVQWPLFSESPRHIIKGMGHGGSKSYWWCASSVSNSAGTICAVNQSGYPDRASAASSAVAVGSPVCFLLG